MHGVELRPTSTQPPSLTSSSIATIIVSPLGMTDTLNPATLLSRRFRFDQIPDLTGKLAIVTGGSAGIGYYNALPLARAGAEVVIISANADKGTTAEGEINKNIQESNSSGSVRWSGCDLGNLKEVDALATKLANDLKRLDILICNAGIGQAPFGLTDDGLERHFEVNNLSHYVLINRLLPLMKKTSESSPKASVRIVMQSSELHRFAPGDTQFASKEEVNEDRDGSRLYGRTKLGQILHAQQLVKHKLLSETYPILAISVHPGTVNTEVQKSWTESYGNIVGKALEMFTTVVGKSAAEGAEASLWAATSTDINEGNWRDFQGKYYSEPYGKPDTETDQAKDGKLGDNFWSLCQTLSRELLGDDV
ncbi:hypothetical protein QCA50_012498 [Cerrena zonata]|uniref:NAD(P)-binding protein n=1 Tax=Cerrena zonata TaxID=2478898 RepID=A0AAW0FUK7_9APHY